MVFIFDANSHFARVYMAATKHGMPNITYQDHAVFVLQPLKQLIEKEIRQVQAKGYDFSHIVMVFDAEGPCFRHQICDQYKSNRKPKDPEYRQQIALAVKMFETLGYPCLQIPNVEADDVLATLSTRLASRSIPNIIFSGDKDILCLVNEHTQQYAGKPQILYDIDAVESKLEVRPEQLLDYLTMVGDVVDNIPGITGLGHKGAAAILKRFSLAQILEDPSLLRRIKLRNMNNVVRYVRQNQENILRSQALVKLKTDVDLKVNLKQLVKQPAITTNYLPHIVNALS